MGSPGPRSTNELCSNLGNVRADHWLAVSLATESSSSTADELLDSPRSASSNGSSRCSTLSTTPQRRQLSIAEFFFYNELRSTLGHVHAEHWLATAASPCIPSRQASQAGSGQLNNRTTSAQEPAALRSANGMATASSPRLCVLDQCGSASSVPVCPSLPASNVVVARLNHLLESVCSQHDLALAEVLTPREDGTCLVQMSSAFFLKDIELEGFHRASAEFVFPLEVGIPGRVWKHRNFAWHGNVSSLPSSIFLRAELAKQASLRGCVAIPLHEATTGNFFVIIFYSQREFGSRDSAEQVLNSIRTVLAKMPGHPQRVIPAPAACASEVVLGSRSVLSKSRSWSGSWIKSEPNNGMSQPDGECEVVFTETSFAGLRRKHGEKLGLLFTDAAHELFNSPRSVVSSREET